MSGGYTVGREDLEAMMAMAIEGGFSKLLVENLDRIARDLGHLSNIFKKLEALGVELHQPNRGRLSITDVAFQGLMGDEGRRILAERSQFSRNAIARLGKVPTGRCFGYDAVPGQPGELALNDAEAAVVRRIYEMRLDGLSPRAICSLLYEEGVRFPRSGNVTVNGIRHVLTSPRYAGILLYRKHKRTKDRDTAKTTTVLRPRSEWIVVEKEGLRIVDREVWSRVQTIMAKPDEPARFDGVDRTKRYLLSGLVRCPVCTGPLSAGRDRHGTRRFSCGRNLRDGICAFGDSVNIPQLEKVVVSRIRDLLEAPGFVEAYVEAYNTELLRRDVDHDAERRKLSRDCEKLSAKLNASFDRSLSTGISDARVGAYRVAIELKLIEAERRLEKLPPKPRAMGIDGRRMVALREAMAHIASNAPFRPSDEAGMRVAASLRAVVGKVVAVPTSYMAFDYAITLKVGALVDKAGNGTPPGFAEHVVRGSHRWRRRDRHTPELQREVDGSDRRGAFALSDEDWATVRALVDPKVLRKPHRDGDGPRWIVEAALSVALSNGTWDTLPDRFGPDRSKAIYHSARNLRLAGAWDRIAAALVIRDRVRFAVLDPALRGP